MAAKVSLRLYSRDSSPARVTARLGDRLTEPAGADAASGEHHSSRWARSWECATVDGLGAALAECDGFVSSHSEELTDLIGEGWRVDVIVNLRTLDGDALFAIEPAGLQALAALRLRLNFLVLADGPP